MSHVMSENKSKLKESTNDIKNGTDAKSVKPYISVVIPVYNGEKCIRKCVMSLVEQTLDNIEILIVDKSSTDGSKEIEKELLEAYPDKIRVFDLPYSFVAAKGREYGVLQAQADYIAFSDADDWYEPNAMEVLWKAANNSSYDIISYAWNMISDDNIVRVAQSAKIDEIEKMLTSKEMCTFWSKLIRKQLLLDHMPMPMVLTDDAAYVPMLLTHAKKVKYLDVPLYNYVQDVGVTSSRVNRNAITILDGYNFTISESNPKYMDEVVFFVATRYRYARMKYEMYKWEFIHWLQSKAELFVKNKYIKNDPIVSKFILDDLNCNVNLVPNIIYFDGFDNVDVNERKEELLATAFSSTEKTVIAIDEEYHKANKDAFSETLYTAGQKDKLVLYYALKGINETGGYYVGSKIKFKSSIGYIREYSSFFSFTPDCFDNRLNISDDIWGGLSGNAIISELLEIFVENGGKLSVSEIFNDGFADKCGLALNGRQHSDDKLFVANSTLCMRNMENRIYVCEHKDFAIEEIKPAFENAVTLMTMSSSYYVPYLAVWLKSFTSNFSKENNYDIIVLESEININQKKKLLKMVEGMDNVSLRFVDPSGIIGSNKLYVSSKQYSKEAYYRLFIPWVFKNHDKVIVTDCDLISMCDIKELYDVDMGEKSIGAAIDYVYQGLIIRDSSRYTYSIEELEMKQPFNYVNTGVMLLNLNHLRERYDVSDLLQYSVTHKFRIQEQDIINAYYEDDIYYIDLKWNYYVNLNGWTDKCLEFAPTASRNKYIETTKAPAIIHYANVHKPWMFPHVNFAEEYWDYARNTPWYETMLFRMSERKTNEVHSKLKTEIKESSNNIFSKVLSNSNSNSANKKKESLFVKMARPVADIVMPFGTERREKVKSVYFRRKDKNLTAARKEMNDRIKKFQTEGKKKDSIYYPSMSYLNEVKGKYAGKRCFIIGTGPSLTVEDLNALSGEFTFSLNSIYKMFDKTTWRPSFYVNNDVALEYKMASPLSTRLAELTDCLKKYDFNRCFITLSRFDDEIYKICQDRVTFLPVQDYLYQLSQPYIPTLKDDCIKGLQAFGTTVAIAYQIACYMGFSEIYLLGTDCSYMSKAHAYEQSEDDKFLYGNKIRAKSLSDGLFRGFEAIRQHSESHNVKVFNATRGGELELFPRVDLDEIIENSKGE